MMFRNNDFTFIQIKDLRNGGDLFLYLWMFLFLPVVCSILFATPLYFIFKIKNIIYFILLIGIVFILEYFLYTYVASQLNILNGIYNAIAGLIILPLFFYKSIFPFFRSGS